MPPNIPTPISSQSPPHLPSGSMSLGMPRCVSAVANAFARFVVLVFIESEAMSMSSGRIVWIIALKACPFLQLRPKSFTSIPYFLRTNDYFVYIHNKYGYNYTILEVTEMKMCRWACGHTLSKRPCEKRKHQGETEGREYRRKVQESATQVILAT